MDFIVGTFNTPNLFTLHFSPPTSTTQASLYISRNSQAIGNHSWLALSPINSSDVIKGKRFLYATAWIDPPSVAAYSLSSSREITFLNTKPVRARSGYVCASHTHVYSAGGSTGEAFVLNSDGSVGDLVQELSFVDNNDKTEASQALHGDFGGLRSGAHSMDLSPDMQSLYVADIGQNCIWTYSINQRQGGSGDPHLKLGSKHISPRSNDGPRHTWPHPSGRILCSLQEHSSMVDIFSVAPDGVTLTHAQGVRIIPADKDPKDYWADEVRLSTLPPESQEAPRYMYASTRGLKAETKGYVAVFELAADGMVADEEAVCIWETPTSGGIANAIEPAPWGAENGGLEYLAMTDSEEGWVFVLSFDGKQIEEVARVNLGKTEDGKVVQAATAVWL